MRLLPIRVATSLLTAAFGQLGAPRSAGCTTKFAPRWPQIVADAHEVVPVPRTVCMCGSPVPPPPRTTSGERHDVGLVEHDGRCGQHSLALCRPASGVGLGGEASAGSRRMRRAVVHGGVDRDGRAGLNVARSCCRRHDVELGVLHAAAR